jgi:rubredoxin
MQKMQFHEKLKERRYNDNRKCRKCSFTKKNLEKEGILTIENAV